MANVIYSLIVLLSPILVAVILGCCCGASCGWLFYGIFNLMMSLYVLTTTAVNAFMMRVDNTAKTSFWMVYMLLSAAMGLALGIKL